MYQNLKYMLQKKNTTLKTSKITLTLTNLTEITFVIEPKIIYKIIITATKYSYKNYTWAKTKQITYLYRSGIHGTFNPESKSIKHTKCN